MLGLLADLEQDLASFKGAANVLVATDAEGMVQ
jgi:hypothetical protein